MTTYMKVQERVAGQSEIAVGDTIMVNLFEGFKMVGRESKKVLAVSVFYRDIDEADRCIYHTTGRTKFFRVTVE